MWKWSVYRKYYSFYQSLVVFSVNSPLPGVDLDFIIALGLGFKNHGVIIPNKTKKKMMYNGCNYGLWI